MAAEAGFDMKIRVMEFATSLKEAEEGRYQAYFIGWSGRVDPDGNIYIFHKSGRAAEQPRLVRQGCGRVVGQGARQERGCRGTQGGVREDHETLLSEGWVL